MVVLPANKVGLYDQLVNEAASVFTRNRWQLMSAAQNADQFDASGPPPGLTRTLLQAWDIPDFDSLTQVMAYAADNPSYCTAQALTLEERQNLYTTLRWDSPIGLAPTPINGYLIETLKMVNGDAERNDFASYMDSAVYNMNSKYGWTIAMAGNATTGVINEYVNLWGISDLSTLEPAITEYRSDPRWSGAVTRVTTTPWTPRTLPAFGAAK